MVDDLISLCSLSNVIRQFCVNLLLLQTCVNVLAGLFYTKKGNVDGDCEAV